MSDKDLQTINISPQKPKRSSLKLANLMDPKEIMNYSKKKRNSVSFQIGGNIKFRELKTKFEEIKKDEGKKKNPTQFLEARKKSIKNEFALVKELLKKQEVIEEIEEEEDVKENTENNMKVGKEYEEKESDSDSKSKSSENVSDDNKKSMNNNEEKKEEKKIEEKEKIIEEKEKIIEEKKNLDDNSEDDDIEAPKTNREEQEQLEEKKKEINQNCKFC